MTCWAGAVVAHHLRVWGRRGCAVLLLLAPALTLAQASVPAVVPVTDAPQISVVTFAPGDIYWQRFGHNALLVRELDGRQRLYNYGIFDFAQKNFFLNFARGRMQYRLAEQPLYDALLPYQHEGRWAYEQRLGLRPARRRELAAFLAWNARPENADYRYDYFSSNCSTRVRDAIDRTLDGALRPQLLAQQLSPASSTYRGEIARLMAPQPALALGMDLLLGPAGDVPLNLWQHSFLPEVLMQALRQARITDASGASRPLVEAEGWLLAPMAPAATVTVPSRDPVWPALAAGILLAALLLGLGHFRGYAVARRAQAVLGAASVTVLGGLGLVLLASWTLTEHWAIWGNHNLLLLNPLSLLLLPAWIGARAANWRVSKLSVVTALLVAAGAVLTIPLQWLPGAQLQGPWIALLLPWQLALVGLIGRAYSR